MPFSGSMLNFGRANDHVGLGYLLKVHEKRFVHNGGPLRRSIGSNQFEHVRLLTKPPIIHGPSSLGAKWHTFLKGFDSGTPWKVLVVSIEWNSFPFCDCFSPIMLVSSHLFDHRYHVVSPKRDLQQIPLPPFFPSIFSPSPKS